MERVFVPVTTTNALREIRLQTSRTFLSISQRRHFVMGRTTIVTQIDSCDDVVGDGVTDQLTGDTLPQYGV